MEQRRPPQQQGRRRPVNVAEIMAQIRRRIEQKKRDLKMGSELEDLQAMRLKPLPDPHQVKAMKPRELYSNSDERPRQLLAAPPSRTWPPLSDPFTRPSLEYDKPNVSVETLFFSSRGVAGRILMVIRRFTRPLLKLFMNVDAYVAEQANVNQVLRNQTVALSDRMHEMIVVLRDRDDQILNRLDELRDRQATQSDRMAAVISEHIGRTTNYVRLLHGIQTSLVAELTKLAIENQNLRSRLGDLGDKLDMQSKREAILEEQVQKIEEAVVEPGAEAPGDPAAPQPGDERS